MISVKIEVMNTLEMTPPVSLAPVRVLVVDDHPNTASTLARAIAQLGSRVDVMWATSGEQALERTQGGPIDILITDMIMPEMTGLELIEKMQNHPGGSPTFTYLITAYDVPGLRVTAHRLKVNDVIIKPVRPEHICEITSQALDAMQHSRPAARPALRKRQAFKILIADDQPDNISLLIRYLQNEGYDFITAADGMSALNKIRDELPDLVLLDINMPKMDGLAALEEIRSDPAIDFIPVIILTAARLDAADVQTGLNLGADDYVTKPFDRRELMARIRTKLRVKQAEDALRRRNRELNLLPEIGRALSASLDVEELANILLKRTVETLGAILGHLILINPDGTFQASYHFSAPHASLLSSTLPIEQQPVLDGLLETIRETQQGFVIQDTLDDLRWRSLSKDPTRSAVIVPLLGRRSLLGLLILTHEQENYFNLDHSLLVQAIASQAAIAVENSGLHASVAHEQRRLAAVLQNAEEAILVFDTNGRIGLLNSHAERLFTEPALKLGQSLPDEQGCRALAELLNQVRISHAVRSAEIVLAGQRTFAAQVTPIEDSGSLVILHDVTHFKNLEKIKNEFIATASHDLKNPITSIAGFSRLLAVAGPLNNDQAGFVQRILNAAAHMDELVQDMLDLARLDIEPAQKQELVDMKALLNEMEAYFAPLAKEKDQQLSFSHAAAQVYVKGNPLQLRQVFRNLIGNAIKYTPQGGSISVTLQRNPDSLRIKVEDTGIGIPKEDLALIFNRFYRVRNDQTSEIEGNGLGLSIVKTITEQHGGRVSAESEVGHGSCFSVTLPVIQSPQFAATERVQTRPVY